ncbi:glycosyltransferase family 39 protein [Enterococcus rotai]|uniref:glycosyltransferase family 39 protein n=1 Tax=Enterococcus rotai TaxID=118060 RepID=UPI0032B4B79B
MKKKIFSILNCLFLLSILYTFYGTLRSSLLDISNINDKVWAFLLILFFIICIAFVPTNTRSYIQKKLKQFFAFFKKNIAIITMLLFAVGVTLQVIILYYIHVPIGWDVDGIHASVTELVKNSPDSIASIYLSKNPNNNLFFFLMYFITQIGNFFHQSLGNSWMFWQLTNTIFMDIGFIFIFLTAKNLFNKKIAYLSFYLAFIPLALSPWMMVVYTDTIMLPVISITLWIYSLAKKKHNHYLMIVLGILIAISYLLKPSSIVFLIAYSMIALLNLLTNPKKINLKKVLLITVLFCLSFAGTIKLFHLFEDQQKLIVIDPNQAKPWQHFVMMGLTGSGGFSEEDTRATISIPTKEGKVNYANEKIAERIKNYGFTGYTKFLMKKHFNNTDRGDFGWGRDGGPQIYLQSNDPIQIFLRDTYYQQGEKVKTVRLFMHLMWMITLVGLLFVTRKQFNNDPNDTLLAILKLTILGAFLYLLLFEGGRSRYLIQYLPFIYMLSANGFYLQFTAIKKIKNP